MAPIKIFLIIKDWQGNVRVTIDQNGNVVEAVDYYPYGMVMEKGNEIATGAQPYKYGGKELDRRFGYDSYDFEARVYDPALGRFTAPDPLAWDTPWLSPCVYCASNPIRYIDPTGMEVDASWLGLYDKTFKTNFATQFIQDLSFITGLSINIDNQGKLQYEKDKNGNAVVRTNEDGTYLGSETARNHIISIINSSETITIGASKGSSSPHHSNDIGLNMSQIQSFVDGSNNVDNRTLGIGMTFIHESLHTIVGGELSDDKNRYQTGDVVDFVNTIRYELNSQGYNFGNRMQYTSIPIGKYAYLGFDIKSALQISSRIIPSNSSFIRYPIK